MNQTFLDVSQKSNKDRFIDDLDALSAQINSNKLKSYNLEQIESDDSDIEMQDESVSSSSQNNDNLANVKGAESNQNQISGVSHQQSDMATENTKDNDSIADSASQQSSIFGSKNFPKFLASPVFSRTGANTQSTSQTPEKRMRAISFLEKPLQFRSPLIQPQIKAHSTPEQKLQLENFLEIVNIKKGIKPKNQPRISISDLDGLCPRNINFDQVQEPFFPQQLNPFESSNLFNQISQDNIQENCEYSNFSNFSCQSQNSNNCGKINIQDGQGITGCLNSTIEGSGLNAKTLSFGQNQIFQGQSRVINQNNQNFKNLPLFMTQNFQGDLQVNPLLLVTQLNNDSVQALAGNCGPDWKYEAIHVKPKMNMKKQVECPDAHSPKPKQNQNNSQDSQNIQSSNQVLIQYLQQ
eukprot:403376836